jgi:hypothetical protein
VWLDPDLQNSQAPAGWIQARTAAEAIQLLDEFTVDELSLLAGTEAEAVIDWLIEQEAAERDRWPAERLVFHGEDSDLAIERFAEAVERRSAAASR